MRRKRGIMAFLAACYIVLTACDGWAAQPLDQAGRPGTARGVAHYIMGFNAELQGAIDEAASYYQEAANEDGSSPVIYMRLAMACAQLERFDDARRAAENAVRVDPGNLAAHYFLGLLHSQKKEDDKASLEYEVILKALAAKDPGNGEFPTYLGQLYYAGGREAQAMEQFALALKLDPKNVALLYILGSYYLEVGRRDEGMGIVKQCLAIEPANADCLNSLAYAYAEDNSHLDEALKHVNTALAAEPDNPAYLDTRGWIYYRQGRYEDALKELTRANGILKDATIFEHLAEVALKLGRPEDAKKYQQQKEQLDAKNRKAP